MTSAPRPELNKLIAALERHLEACTSRRGEDDPTVIAAYEDLADAFEAYDDALEAATGEMTPLIVVDEQLADEIVGRDESRGDASGDSGDPDDDASSGDGYDEDEDEQSYSGLDDEDYDADDRRG